MSKFKIGDKVILNGFTWYYAYYNLSENREYTIFNILDSELQILNNYNRAITIGIKYFNLSPKYVRDKTIENILS